MKQEMCEKKISHFLKETFKVDDEFFSLYVQSHGVLLKLIPIIVVFVVLIKFHLYGISLDLRSILIGAVLLGLGAFFYYKQLTLFANILKKDDFREKERDARTNYLMVLDFIVNKSCYTVVWLTILFLPIKSDLFYDHLLGFVYVFCVIAIYPSISASVWILFVYDMSIHLIFLFFITLYNFGVQETPLAGVIIAAFSVYSFIIGKKLNIVSTEILHSKKKLQAAVKSAQHAHDAKTDFLAVMSHEIRTPMNGIIGMIDFLRETKMTLEQNQCIKTIDECSGSLLNTLNDVLDYSKIEAGKFDIRPRNFDLKAWVEHVSSMFRQRAKQGDNAFSVYIADDVPHSMFGDANRLQQIAVNLLNNAYNYTKDGIVTFSVYYVEKSKGGFIRMEVKDTGIGISQKDQERLFRKYSQVGDTSAHKYENKGTGLGLSIAQRLVTLLGGDIGVESTKGQGSLFWFEVPYNLPVNVEPEEKSEKAGYKNSLDTYYVLLVDDNELNQQIVGRHLEKRGHKVLHAHSGEQAIQYVQQGHGVDAILMDLHMAGGKDGIETTKHIRKNYPSYNKVPIIAITANLMEESLKACYGAGMVDHIAKPIEKDDLFIKLHHNISKSKQKKLVVEKGTSEILAPQKIDPIVPDSMMKKKCRELCNEFGREYTDYIIQSTLEEVGTLIESIQRAFVSEDIDGMLEFAHDLISVGGNVGMMETSKICVQIEDSAGVAERQIKAREIKKLSDVAMSESHLLMTLNY